MSDRSLPIVRRCVDLDSTSEVPLHRQLYRALREAILSGRLLPEMQLPATRTLADALGISRNTVLNTFEQLKAEGYLNSHVGSGTYVAQTLPDDLDRVRGESHLGSSTARVLGDSPNESHLSERGQYVADLQLSPFRDGEQPRAFRPGVPALDAFPIETWSRLTSRRWRSIPASTLGYREPAGYPPLRSAIADYLRESRGVHCSPEQVIVVSGTQQAITIAAHVLLAPGDRAWVEDPGYSRATGAFRWAGAHTVPIPLDAEGLDLDAGRARSESARLAYVTPSHQYPMGITMSLPRRLELLEWAEQSEAWILEDDYDSEYRYEGRPIAALQGLDEAGRVIYVGSFSKVLFPSLRLGYLVVPDPLVDPFTRAKSLVDRCPSLVPQMVVTDFIEEGYFERHLRRMRTLYADRQSVLIETLNERLGHWLDVNADEAGLHLTAFLDERLDGSAVADAIETRGVVAPRLSFYASRPLNRDGLVLGYASVDKEALREGVGHLADALTAAHEAGPNSAAR